MPLCLCSCSRCSQDFTLCTCVGGPHGPPARECSEHGDPDDLAYELWRDCHLENA